MVGGEGGFDLEEGRGIIPSGGGPGKTLISWANTPTGCIWCMPVIMSVWEGRGFSPAFPPPAPSAGVEGEESVRSRKTPIQGFPLLSIPVNVLDTLGFRMLIVL